MNFSSIKLLILSTAFMASACAKAEGVFETPTWQYSIVGELFPLEAESVKKKLKTRDIITGLQLKNEMQRTTPDFLKQAQLLWDEADAEQKKTILNLTKQKLNFTLLTLSLAHSLDRQAQIWGINLEASRERLDYAVETVLLQMALESSLKIPFSQFKNSNLNQKFAFLKKAEQAIKQEADRRGESYLELHLDQNWRNSKLGIFHESDDTFNSIAEWPAMAIEFRCLKTESGWSSCFPESLGELRKSIQKTIQNAFKTTLRDQAFNTLLVKDHPRLDQQLNIMLPKEFEASYEELKDSYFRIQKVLSKKLIIRSTNSEFIDNEHGTSLITRFLELQKSKPEWTENDLRALDDENFQYSLSITEDSSELQGAPQLNCLGQFSFYPCEVSEDKKTLNVLLERKVTSRSDTFIPKENPKVREMIEKAVYLKKLKTAQAYTINKLLMDGHFIIQQDLSSTRSNEKSPWPKLPVRQSMPMSVLMKDVDDLTLVLSALKDCS